MNMHSTIHHPPPRNISTSFLIFFPFLFIFKKPLLQTRLLLQTYGYSIEISMLSPFEIKTLERKFEYSLDEASL